MDYASAHTSKVSERGVCVFRNQKLDNDSHKELIDRIGALSGRPKENGLMKSALHPIYGEDPEVLTLIPEGVAERYGFQKTSHKRQNLAEEWHSDMSFEPNPADYSSLRLGDVPITGGGGYFPSIGTSTSLTGFSQIPCLLHVTSCTTGRSFGQEISPR